MSVRPGNIALATASTLVALLGAEVGLRILLPVSDSYFVLPPGTGRTVRPAPDAAPGITGVSHYRVNRSGIRGREFGGGPDSTEFRILAVGGSTTQTPNLDDTETWTYLLEQDLGTAGGRRAWVGNVGRSGFTTRDHVLHLKYLLPRYPRIGVVVALVGVNDLAAALAQGWEYRLPPPITDPAAEAERLPHAFARIPGPLWDAGRNYGSTAVPWYKQTVIWQLARRAKRAVPGGRRPVDAGSAEWLVRARALRAAAAKVDSLPPLGKPLYEYRRNLEAMARHAQDAGAELVLVTQPTTWRRGMSAAEEERLWFGWIGADWLAARAWYTTAALARAMNAWNRELLAVCRDLGLRCVDAAGLVPRDTTVIYDDVHFTERGARTLAALLATRLSDVRR
jgi:hypothetical protein